MSEKKRNFEAVEILLPLPQLTIIGKVISSLKDLEDCPLQETENAPPARIRIFNEFAAAAKDIRVGDRLILITWLGLADRATLTTHPRNDPASPLTGVFSTRSPHRPNPIGMHTVEVTALISGNEFEVSGLEVLDQTPLLDIKVSL